MTPAQPLQDVHKLDSTISTTVHPEPVAEKPKLSLVPAVDPAPNVMEVFKLYLAQKRECWFCQKVAELLQAGKEASDDEKWHFTTCVLSWEHLNHPPK